MLANRIISSAGDGDPYFSNVVALLHMDGSNLDTSIVDVTGRAWSRTGTGTFLSNEQTKFGTTSLKNTNYSSDFNTAAGILTGTDLFTIEGWFYLLGPAFYGGNYRANTLIAQSPGGAHGGFGLEIDPSGKLWMDFRAGNAGDGGVGGTTTVSYNQWYFFAISWDGTTHRGFLNGNMEYSVAKSFGWKNTGAPFRLGRMTETPSDWERAINGYLDEIRVTTGVARYTANFTPPTAPFPNG